MPEGPEVFLTAQKINSLIAGKKLTSLEYRRGNFDASALVGKTAVAEVYGKNLFLNFGSMSLLVHAALDGTWSLEDNKAEAVLTFDDTVLYYKEPMHIGQFKLLSPAEKTTYLATLGPDARTMTLAQFTKVMQSEQKLALLLMDQKKIAGIGNYLRSELLAKSGINPFTIANTLTTEQIEHLFKTMHKLYTTIIKKGGSEYYPIFGKYGGYKMKVYKNPNAKVMTIQKRKLYYI